MKRQPIKRIPVLIAVGAILLIGLLRWARVGFFESLERMTYDIRVRKALRFAPTVATNLGFVFIDDASIAFVRTNQSLKWQAGLYWPRHVYGRVVLPRGGDDDIKVPLDRDGNFDLAAFGGENLPPGVARKAKPFTEERLWHMGVVLAARELQVVLAKAEVDRPAPDAPSRTYFLLVIRGAPR